MWSKDDCTTKHGPLVKRYDEEMLHWNRAVGAAEGTRGLVTLPGGRLLAAHTRPYKEGKAIFLSESRDGGGAWRELSVIVSDPDPEVDLGDGNLARVAPDTILYTYRHNFHGGRHRDAPRYAIRVSASRDGGRSWRHHSTAIENAPPSGGPSRGFWAPSLSVLPSGAIACLYDDEDTPFVEGFKGHQWLTLRTWNASARRWVNPITVARAHDPRHLSRDGMGTVVSLGGNRLGCAFESVAVAPPHQNLVRWVTSDDAGKTWSWQRRERNTVYAPPRAPYMALSPHLIRLRGSSLACVFCTDEDRPAPDRSGTPPHRLNMDIKLVTSRDGSKWSRAETVYADSHRCYLPGLVETAPGQVLATWIDFKAGKLLSREGAEI